MAVSLSLSFSLNLLSETRVFAFTCETRINIDRAVQRGFSRDACLFQYLISPQLSTRGNRASVPSRVGYFTILTTLSEILDLL